MRTKGAKDLKKRKQRKFYAGKPIKKKRRKDGKLVPYVSKRNRNDSIKVWFWERKRMSYDGYQRFPRHIRPYVKKIITKFVGKPVRVDPEFLSNIESIKQLAIDIIGYDGTFLLMMPTHSKNTYRVSYKKKAVIKIIETEEGLKAKVFEYFNLSRYWFFRGDKNERR